ncbi:hypothetical protein glysoja_031022 [Glycine soja]|uniref:Uncharacterized protein n=1 Tax=Glycine soja TaxID=3848 RepID=A0A0B2QZJ4_GLYSO|nr:hypothetical protein glysoja_031022 [Glycine soja]
MRIRKNAKLSPLLFSSSSCLQGGSVPLETHVCQLNQSPWDVIPFDSDSIQFQLDHSFAAGNNNGSENSFGAVESSNPYEFYYYSGFGPLWGKRRGDRNGGEGSKNSSVGVENSTMVESKNGVGGADDGINDNVASVEVGPSVSEMEHEGIIDYVDDDEEEEGEEEGVDDSGKKRMRKPVKARSLKSLM